MIILIGPYISIDDLRMIIYLSILDQFSIDNRSILRMKEIDLNLYSLRLDENLRLLQENHELKHLQLRLIESKKK
jgi:hypothetical protein